ncbi:MAG: D-glycero-beta-D-manno-heptose 1-phosphate adenylyltransferase [Candidatus Omnitrophica bacterium]|nr:D-glycero-beta-D-manno-heptose 1-phosphate adenylyltransferase [Candidatus Omnitrophota bacterium]
MVSKVIKVSKLAHLVKTLKKKKKKIVFTNGCFDLIHPGHIKLLSSAKKQGEVLILGLNSDSSIRKIKGEKRPILKEKERIEILSAITYIDYIVVFKEETPFKLVKIIKPDVLVKGGDWEEKDIVGADLVKKQGGKIVRIRLKKGYSTTTLIEKIKKIYEK